MVGQAGRRELALRCLEGGLALEPGASASSAMGTLRMQARRAKAENAGTLLIDLKRARGAGGSAEALR